MSNRISAAVLVTVLAGAGYYLYATRQPHHVSFDDREMQVSLNRIELWMKGHAAEIAGGLRPGASTKQLEALARSRKVAIPEEIYSLYSWHDGESAELPFFDEYRFLPAKEAFAYGDALHQVHPGRPYELPFLRSTVSSAVYVVTCVPSAADTARVAFEYRETVNQGDSLTSFLKALSKSFDLGAFEYVAANRTLRTKSALLRRVLLEILPERQEALRRILEGYPQKLSPDDEMAAYQDLLATKDPSAEKLILLAAERWAFDDEYSFTTMQRLADLHTLAAFDEMQKLARHSNPAIRKRAYAMFAFWWPADGRKWDLKTELTAVDDLEKGAFEDLDLRIIVRALARSSGSPSVVAAILPMLANLERDTRRAAAQTLGLLGDKRAIPALRARTAVEEDPDVKESCARAVWDLGGTLAE